jgi:transcriptional regulator with XRE-family HTH domain
VDNPILKAFGDRVRLKREKACLSQENFAESVGVHRTYIGSVERGERNLSLVNIDKIAGALGLSLSDLFQGIGRKTR